MRTLKRPRYLTKFRKDDPSKEETRTIRCWNFQDLGNSEVRMMRERERGVSPRRRETGVSEEEG